MFFEVRNKVARYFLSIQYDAFWLKDSGTNTVEILDIFCRYPANLENHETQGDNGYGVLGFAAGGSADIGN